MKPAREEPPSPCLETVLSHVVSAYQQTTTVASGTVISGVKYMDEIESIKMHPLCHFEAGCPQNFSDFSQSSSAHGFEKAEEAFSWYCRSRLRYSCSTLTAGFVRFVVPEIKRCYGYVELPSETLENTVVHLSNLEIYTVLFRPQTQHAIEFVRPFIGAVKEVVEPTQGEFALCSHNFLKCRQSGVIVDFSIGQFTSVMLPQVFQSMDEFRSSLPGQIFRVYLTPEASIDQQIIRDDENSKLVRNKSPDTKPIKFAKRVVRFLQESKQLCGNCCGVASAGSDLKRCSRCHKALYCSKGCQRLHWKIHKLTCQDVE